MPELFGGCGRDQLVSAAEIPTLDPDVLYELCPACEDAGAGGCMTCWDEGLVPHDCPAED